MNQTTAFGNGIPEEQIDSEVSNFREQFEGRELLDVVVRRGAQQILQQAIEAEVQEFLQQHHDRRDAAGKRLVVRNGHQAARTIVTGAAPWRCGSRGYGIIRRPKAGGCNSARRSCLRTCAGAKLSRSSFLGFTSRGFPREISPKPCRGCWVNRPRGSVPT